MLITTDGNLKSFEIKKCYSATPLAVVCLTSTTSIDAADTRSYYRSGDRKHLRVPKWIEKAIPWCCTSFSSMYTADMSIRIRTVLIKCVIPLQTLLPGYSCVAK